MHEKLLNWSESKSEINIASRWVHRESQFSVYIEQRQRSKKIFAFVQCKSTLTKVVVKQECIPVRCVPSAAVAVCGGVCPEGCLPRGGVPRGCLPGGACQTALHEQNDRQTGVKTFPCRNYVADGKNEQAKLTDVFTVIFRMRRRYVRDSRPS